MELTSALCSQLPPPAQGAVPHDIQLIPPPNADGRIVGEDGRTWRMTDAQKVAAAFNRPLPIDINHAQELNAPKGLESPAAGWIESLEARNGALWGRVRWTEKGAELVRSLAYRFISPVFTFAKSTGEIARLKSAALLNDPNFALALNSAHHSTQEIAPMKRLLELLGLAEAATEDQAINAVQALKNDLATAKTELDTARNAAENPSLDRFVPRADHDAALARASNAEQKLQQHQTQQIESSIEAAIGGALKAGKITPATVEYHRAQCRSEGGLERFNDYVKNAPTIAGDPAQDKDLPAGGGLTEEGRAVCRVMGIPEADFIKHKQELAKAS